MLLAAGAAAAFYLLCVTALVAMRWVDPPTTVVQTQRRIEAWWNRKPYDKRQEWAPLARISTQLQHAVIAAEDGRFYQHKGIDWKEVQKVVDQNLEDGKRWPRRIHHYPTTRQEPFFHHQPVLCAQGHRVHARAGGGACTFEAADPGTLPERNRVGPRRLRRGGRFANLVRGVRRRSWTAIRPRAWPL